MYVMPIWCSLVSFIISVTCGKWLGRCGTIYISISSILWCCICSCIIWYEICICQSTCNIFITKWLSIDTIDICWGFTYDALSSSMLVVITTVSLCANIYSIEYMRTDPHNVRSFSYLSLFTFFMVFLVVSDNALQLFVGWEGVGICSYLLINFWYTRIQANKASILAVITNKIGDISLLIGIAIMCNTVHTVEFAVINACTEKVLSPDYVHLIDQQPIWDSLSTHTMCTESETLLCYYVTHSSNNNAAIAISMRVICVLAAIAAISKSAQAGLHIWLPEAMEGPTPVSSLIHAATMVTAGIFLLVRYSYIFTDVNTIYVLLILIGSITAFFSSTIGLLQNDLKKIVAYSTCSQLGYMFVCCGLAAYNNSMYHLINHAFFKALLFLTAGYIIHAISNEQDIRKMGGMLRILPIQYTMMLVGSLSLIGFPSLSGFFSKDKIIELCFNHYVKILDIVYTYKYVVFTQIFCSLAVIFTLIYSIKLLFYAFINSYCGFRLYVMQIHFSGIYIQIPLLLLAYLSIISGYLTSDMMVGAGTSFWMNSLRADTFILPEYMNILKAQFLLHTEFNPYIRNVTVIWTIYFISIAVISFIYLKYFFVNVFIGGLSWFRQLFTTVCRKYIFINRIIIFTLIRKALHISYDMAYKCFDKGILEFIGPFGVVHCIKQLTMSQHIIQSGLIYHYSGFIFITIIIFLHIVLDFLSYA